MAKGPKVYWPSWRYGPNDQAMICNTQADVPEGWVDHPSKLVAPEPAPEPAPENTQKPAPAAPVSKKAEKAEAYRQALLKEARAKFGAVPEEATVAELEAALAPKAPNGNAG